MSEVATMLIGFTLFLVAAFMVGALLVRLAVHALPVGCALLVGQSVHASGAGWIATITAGAVAAVATLATAQLLLGLARSPATRIAVGIAFALPAALAGYFAMHGIAVTIMPPSIWQTLLSGLAAIIIGVMAWIRLGRSTLDNV